ncbi:hypothetical protein AGIG_G15746 [Arapaima gigas]
MLYTLPLLSSPRRRFLRLFFTLLGTDTSLLSRPGLEPVLPFGVKQFAVINTQLRHRLHFAALNLSWVFLKLKSCSLKAFCPAGHHFQVAEDRTSWSSQ